MPTCGRSSLEPACRNLPSLPQRRGPPCRELVQPRHHSFGKFGALLSERIQDGIVEPLKLREVHDCLPDCNQSYKTPANALVRRQEHLRVSNAAVRGPCVGRNLLSRTDTHIKLLKYGHDTATLGNVPRPNNL